MEIVGKVIILGTVESSILEDKFRLKRTSHPRINFLERLPEFMVKSAEEIWLDALDSRENGDFDDAHEAGKRSSRNR